jgi:hypothetical protein
LRYGSAVKHALRRGDYRSFTFKLPAHYPELRLSVVCETGSVCLYASNCSARPDPRNCQWTLLVDSQKSKLGSLVVRTNEHHFVGGLYHVGLYSVTDSEFSIGCFPTPASASDKLRASTRQRQRTSPAAFSPRPQSRLHTKPFVDAGLLEELCAARGLLVGFGATAPPASSCAQFVLLCSPFPPCSPKNNTSHVLPVYSCRGRGYGGGSFLHLFGVNELDGAAAGPEALSPAFTMRKEGRRTTCELRGWNTVLSRIPSSHFRSHYFHRLRS